MAALAGSYSMPLIGVSIFIAALTYTTYKLLSSYVHKWFQMKPIPGLEGTYPFIGNALQFETNAGDFFKQIVGYTTEYSNAPLLKFWLGTLPFLVLFHAETVEHWAKVASAEKDADSHLPLLHPDGLLGGDERAERDPGGEAKQDGREGMSDIISRRQRTPWFWFGFVYNYFGEGREHDKILKILHSFTYNGTKKRRAFLDMLLKATYEDGNKMTHQDIQEEVDTFMFEGHDTTAAAMNWVLHLLGSHPEAQSKVQQELQEVFGTSDRPVNTEDLKKLRYLDCVIKEALRLFPSVPFFGRNLGEDCHINGFKVPKGANAVVVTYALHRDPRYFPDPEEFRPERFLPENSTGRPPYAYVPFSAGLRNCIGQRFAMMEEKVVLSTILRNFNVEACQTREELRPLGELILRPEKGIWIKLEKRLHKD
ncbi:Cytochrome P450 4V2 [Collichthys lucidus]|uniref:aromatase n=1 Tax=Collichthys lucidus TaxID=240159 RepID=A0A4U5U3Y1_COLLU|nr:Cytochrome P450 4V2 [Collichthys lucidus]